MLLDLKTGRLRNAFQNAIMALALAMVSLIAFPHASRGQARHPATEADLVIAQDGASNAVIVVAADAGPWERRAAADLAKYIAVMSGARLPIVAVADAVRTSILIGKSALAADPGSVAALQRQEDQPGRASGCHIRSPQRQSPVRCRLKR